MDKKYIASTVALPKDTSDKLEEFRAELFAILGFRPSRTEALDYLLKYYQDNQRLAGCGPAGVDALAGFFC